MEENPSDGGDSKSTWRTTTKTGKHVLAPYDRAPFERSNSGYALHQSTARPPPTIFAEHDDADSVRRCMTFHSEWMERTPDKVLEDNVLDRRKRSPVAVVVVIHDETSLVRAALDEIAIVVEHIVSDNVHQCTVKRIGCRERLP